VNKDSRDLLMRCVFAPILGIRFYYSCMASRCVKLYRSGRAGRRQSLTPWGWGCGERLMAQSFPQRKTEAALLYGSVTRVQRHYHVSDVRSLPTFADLLV
jgi:hypothetical protein